MVDPAHSGGAAPDAGGAVRLHGRAARHPTGALRHPAPWPSGRLHGGEGSGPGRGRQHAHDDNGFETAFGIDPAIGVDAAIGSGIGLGSGGENEFARSEAVRRPVGGLRRGGFRPAGRARRAGTPRGAPPHGPPHGPSVVGDADDAGDAHFAGRADGPADDRAPAPTDGLADGRGRPSPPPGSRVPLSRPAREAVGVGGLRALGKDLRPPAHHRVPPRCSAQAHPAGTQEVRTWFGT